MFTRLKSERNRDRDHEKDASFRRRKNPRPPMLQLPRSNSIKYIPFKTGHIEEEITTGLIWSVAARRGRRRLHREDMYTVLPFITDFYQPVSIFAIFDGHGGKRVAEFASKRLPDVFLDKFRESDNVKDSLMFAFLKTDEEVIEEFYSAEKLKNVVVQSLGRKSSSLFSRKSSRSPAHRKSLREDYRGLGETSLRRTKLRDDQNGKVGKGCGCTATVVAMVGNTVNIAHVGDSRAVLCTEKGVRRLCEDHRPGRPDEQRRIESSGGLILDISGTPRVNGVLAVSRSIGDAELKDFVIAKPEVTEISLKGDEEFLVVATDGLWDVVSDDDCMKMVKDVLHKKGSEEEAAKKLVQRAWESGSTDDTCVMIINLIKYGKVRMRDIADAAEFLSPDGVASQREFVPKIERDHQVQNATSLRSPSELPVEIVTPHSEIASTPRVGKNTAWQEKK